MGLIELLIAILAFLLPAAESNYINKWMLKKTKFNGSYTGTSSFSLTSNPSQDISSAAMCWALVKQGETWGLNANFDSSVSSLTEYSFVYSVKFSSTLSDNIFQFGQSSGPHYVFSSTTNGVIDGKFYKDATTTDSANNFQFTIPLSNCYTDKMFYIAFNWVKDSNSAVTLNILISGKGKSTFTSVAGSTSPFQLPFGYMLFGKSVYAEFYYVYLSKSVSFVGTDYGTIYATDSTNASSNVSSSTCNYDCIDDVCDEDKACISSKKLCQCTQSNDCNSCIEPTRSSGFYCEKCKTGFSFTNHHCCSDSLNCLDCSSSGTVCTLCAAGYFLYDNGSGTTSCVLCAASCTACDASTCYKCAEIVNLDSTTCRVDSLGFKYHFSDPFIIIDFAHASTNTYKIESLVASYDDGRTKDTSGWTVYSSTSKQMQIQTTDFSEADLPIKIDFIFGYA